MQPQIDNQPQQPIPVTPPPPTLVQPLAPAPPVANVEVPTIPASIQNQPVVSAPMYDSVSTVATPKTTPSMIAKLPALLFYLGFASIFLINFVNATVDAKSFTALLDTNVFVPSFLPKHLLVGVAAVNDLVVGILILSRWQKKWVYGWAGSWLLIVAVTKAGHFLV